METIINRLATSLGRKDEIPNQKLALEIIENENTSVISELIHHLKSSKNKSIQSDCIKVLYEVGEVKPKLIANHHIDFVEVLNSQNNRLVWGAMTALDAIAATHPGIVAQHLPEILKTSDKGSVITKDHTVGILIKLASQKEFVDTAIPLLLEQLKVCPIRQLPMYGERSVVVIDHNQRNAFISLLSNRIDECEKDSQRIRIEKTIKKLNRI